MHDFQLSRKILIRSHFRVRTVRRFCAMQRAVHYPGILSAPAYIRCSRHGLKRRRRHSLNHWLFIAGRRRCRLFDRFSFLVSQMPQRRRRVFVDTPRGRRSAGFSVPEHADAADVSLRLRERGWAPYRLRIDPDLQAWVAVVIDWQRAA